MDQRRLLGFICIFVLFTFVAAKGKVHLFDRCGETIWVNDYDYYTVEIDGSDWPSSWDECAVTFEALDIIDLLYYRLRNLDIDDKDIKLSLDSSAFGLTYFNQASYQKGDDIDSSRKLTNTYLRVTVTRNAGSTSTDIDVKLNIYDTDYTNLSVGGIVGIAFGSIGFVVLGGIIVAVVRAMKISRGRRGQVIGQNNTVTQATTVTMATYPAPGAFPSNTAGFAPNMYGYGGPPAQGYGYPSQSPYPVQSIGAYPDSGTGVVGTQQTQPTHVASPMGAPQPTPVDVPAYPPPKYDEKY